MIDRPYFLSARDLERMRPQDAKRYRDEVIGKPGDANAHPALEAGEISHGKGWDFAAPPKNTGRP